MHRFSAFRNLPGLAQLGIYRSLPGLVQPGIYRSLPGLALLGIKPVWKFSISWPAYVCRLPSCEDQVTFSRFLRIVLGNLI